MRLGIDLQSLQLHSDLTTVHAKEKISLVHAVIGKSPRDAVILFLSGMFPNTISPIRALFDKVLPQQNIAVWHSPGPIHQSNPDYTWRFQCAQHIRDSFIAAKKLDALILIDFFIGYGEDVFNEINAELPPTFVFLLQHFSLSSSDFGLDSYKLNKLANLQIAKQVVCSSELVGELHNAGLVPSQVFDSKCDFNKVVEACVEELLASNKLKVVSEINVSGEKFKMAFISPLPPERSGIADFSAELLPALAEFYDIDVFVDIQVIRSNQSSNNYNLKNLQDLPLEYELYDRVFYHIGNSPNHSRAAELVNKCPGVVAFHDLYLGDLRYYQQHHDGLSYKWFTELYQGHGFTSLLELARAKDLLEVLHKYPCHFSIVKDAIGGIVHSKSAIDLVQTWNDKKVANKFDYVPLARKAARCFSQKSVRNSLGFAENDIVICSFGMLGPTKFNDRLLKAWLKSPLSKAPQYKLVFVGENDPELYGKNLLETIQFEELKDSVTITGWVSSEEYTRYLNVANLAIQLRSTSRGEASAAALDCLNYGIPLIVNEVGALSELPHELVKTVSQECTIGELTQQLSDFHFKHDEFTVSAEKSQKYIEQNHSVSACAKAYFETIENQYKQLKFGRSDLISNLVKNDLIPKDDETLISIAKSIGKTFPTVKPKGSIFIDVTAICQNDLKTGIQRVVRALLIEFILNPPEGFRIEPVYLTDEGNRWHYRFARNYTLNLLDYPSGILVDDELEVSPGDMFLGLDYSGPCIAEADKANVFNLFHENGAKVYFVIYDLLPITLSQYFPNESLHGHTNWLKTITKYDGVICISKAVAEETMAWLSTNKNYENDPKVGYFHLGADVENSIPTTGIPINAASTLALMRKRPTFVMVGTLEPRKGHSYILDVFTLLWRSKVDVNLVIVGKQGWMVDKLASDIKVHSELNEHLHWIEDASDEYLESIYQVSTCLIAASEGEGFGLPIIEAARHNVPIFARDIPVFREVAGDCAFYFSGDDKSKTLDEIKYWLELHKKDMHPKSEKVTILSWKQSSEQLKQVISGGSWLGSINDVIRR